MNETTVEQVETERERLARAHGAEPGDLSRVIQMLDRSAAAGVWPAPASASKPGLGVVTAVPLEDVEAARRAVAEEGAEMVAVAAGQDPSLPVGPAPSIGPIPVQIMTDAVDPAWALEAGWAWGASSIAGNRLGVSGTTASFDGWDLADRFIAVLAQRGMAVDRTCRVRPDAVLIPPGLACAWVVLDALAATVHGVRRLTLSATATSSIDQDVATVRALRVLAGRYLAPLGVDSAYEVLGCWPADELDEARAAARAGLVTLIAVRAGADIAMLWPQNASGQVTTASRAARQATGVRRLLRSQPATGSAAIATEAEAIVAEAAAMVDAVVRAGDGDVVAGLVARVRDGSLGVETGRDGEARCTFTATKDERHAIRFVDTGALPLGPEVKAFHEAQLVSAGRRP